MRDVNEDGSVMSLWEQPAGIVRVGWAPSLTITRTLAERAVEAVNRHNAGMPRPLLVNMTGTAALTREARVVFGRPCAVSRLALLGQSLVDRVLANFAVGVGSHPMPMRFFTSESHALRWLQRAGPPASTDESEP